MIGNMPGGSGTGNPPGTTAQSGTGSGFAITIGVLLLLLVGAIVFVAKPRKNML